MNRNDALSRRRFLGAAAASPWLTGGLEQVAHLARGPQGSNRSLLVVWLDGGMSHVDTFDGKPEAPSSIRGDLRSVESNVEGVFVSENLPGLKTRMDRVALLRGLAHGDGNHDRGSHLWWTGHRPSPVLTHASLGASVARATRGDDPMPRFVALPSPPQYAGAGYLPAQFGPLILPADPRTAPTTLPGLNGKGGDEDLVGLLDGLDGAPRSRSEKARDAVQAQARRLRSDPGLREHFSLRGVPEKERERYGRHRLGQSVLLAKRLCAAGSRVVVVNDRGWDHHQGIARALTFGYPPKLQALDESLSALLDDLRDSELGERVTVLVASEFGRTPRINPAGGRDHWPRAQCALLAGAGVKQGIAVGRTDPNGEEPIERETSPSEVFATLCSLLELQPGTLHETPDGRPVPLIPRGVEPIAEVLT